MIKSIDATYLAKLFLAGAKNLESKKEIINELNVFPVPDGDTGTNMTMTILSAVKAIEELHQKDMESICKAISSGSLRGARGNSGVILSQLLRGFTKSIIKEDELDTLKIANAFMNAKETAYKAVIKPKEGTILTVAKEMAQKADEIKEETESIEEFAEEVLKKGLEALDNTPNLLPVLKEANVVDSGGRGLIEFFIGIQNFLIGKVTDESLNETLINDSYVNNDSNLNVIKISQEEIKFGYCTEFIISCDRTFTSADEINMKHFLSKIGDSLVVVVDDGLVKIHVHTDSPGLVIQRGLEFGELLNIKIDNLRQEHREVLFKQEQKNVPSKQKEEKEEKLIIAKQEQKEMAFVVISQGKGIDKIFKELGADKIITGGQTMNPSTDDILNAIENIPAKNIFILPNNGNIILAAKQAVELVENKNVIVIPTKSIPQGISALVNFLPEEDVETNLKTMEEAIDFVKTAEITYAIRDTKMDKQKINKGDIMGIGEGKLLAVGKKITNILVETIEKLVDANSSVISIYYGENINEKEAKKALKTVQKKFEDFEIEFQYGGQSIYYYFIAIE